MYQKRLHKSCLAVGRKRSDNLNIFQIPYENENSYRADLIKCRDWLRQKNREIPGLWHN